MAEQELYRREGLGWHGLDLPDSTPAPWCSGRREGVLKNERSNGRMQDLAISTSSGSSYHRVF